MAKKTQPVHLLILDPSQNEAEKIVSLLRNAGLATRAHRLTSQEDLVEQLKAQPWDLLIANEQGQTEDLTLDDILTVIRDMEKDLPVLVRSEQQDEDHTTELMRHGVADVIPAGHPKHLVLAAKRELAAHQARLTIRQLRLQLKEAEKRCQLLLESSMDAIAYINEGMHIYANKAYLDMMGYEDVDELMCIPVIDTIKPADKDRFKEFLKQMEKEGAQEASLSVHIRNSDDEDIAVTLTGSPATYDGEACLQIVVRPETDAELEAQLRKVASQDPLTGLYNRLYFDNLTDQTVRDAVEGRFKGTLINLLVDGYDEVRAQHGIQGTDALMVEVANLIRSQCPEQFTLARISDDIIAILAPATDESQARALCEKLLASVRDHLIEFNGKTLQTTLSAGIVLINDSVPDKEELLNRANQAVNHVLSLEGHEKGDGIYVYTPRDFASDQACDRDMMDILQEALDQSRFKLLFQPIISLRGDSQEHYEAFLRLINEAGEEISPSEFLPIEDKPELAIKLDRWVIIQNIKSLSAHRSKGHDTRLFINVTNHTVTDKTFVPWLSVALKAARLPGSSLVFQVSEPDAVAHLKQAKQFVDGVKDLGCGASLSRFGGALNPFNTLKHLNVDYVKLDGAYTEDIQKGAEEKEKVRELINQLHEAGKRTIVPFVESASVLSTLWQAGVHYIQGYYLQAPAESMNYDFSEME